MTNDPNHTGTGVRSDPETRRALRESATRCIKAATKTLLPSIVAEELRRYRTYTPPERAIYLKLRMLNAVGVINLKALRPSRTAHSFLFVCFGNIMRSPMCEVLMKRACSLRTREITVASAGLNAVPGRSAHPWAVVAAKELGVSLEAHRAQVLTAEVVVKAEVIFAMDYQNLVQLRSRYPEARNRIFMLGAYAGRNNRSLEISDPYYSDEDGTRQCYKALEICIENLVSSLSDK